MRKLIYLLAFVLMFTVYLGFTTDKHVDADESNVREIGTALNTVSIPAAGYGKGPNGEDWIYAVAGGSPAVFNVVDAKTGERVDSFHLDGASNAWGVTVDPNGIVYIGSYSNANLYRYVPGDDEVENLGNPIPGESFIWRIASDEDGRIYGGTYPSGKVFQYDPETGEFRDYGQVAEGQQYARSIDVYQNKAYVGAGTETPHLVELDIETGETTEIELPGKFADQSNVYDVDVAGNKLFARVTGISTLLVYDLETMELLDEIENASGLDVSQAGPNNLVYFSINGSLHSYNLNSLELTEVGYDDFGTARGFGWFEFNETDLPGETLVSIQWDGEVRKYNPETENKEAIPGQINGEPVDIQSLTQGPNGNIYVGGYFGGGLAEYNFTTDQLTEYKGMGQIEGMVAHNDQLYMGVYSGAHIYSYNPDEPYDYGVNPVEHFSLKNEGQDRPFAMTSAGEKLAIGTVPTYGELGGGLTIFDPATDDYTFHRNVVQNQSVIALEYKDGLIYGGTSIWGGLGIDPTEDEAKLFVWNMEGQEKVLETVPVPGEKAISDLTFDDEGNLWGLTSGILFKYDIDKNEVVERKELYPENWDEISHLWRGGFLTFHNDGNLYGQSRGELFKVNPETLEHETLVENALLFAEDAAGNFYFARGHKLYQYEMPLTLEDATLYAEDTTILQGEETKLNLEITLSNGETVDLEETEIEWVNTDSQVATIEEGIITGNNAGSTNIHAIVSYNGEEITTNTITVTVDISTSSLTDQINQLEESDQIKHSLAKKLANRLRQAQHHYQNGRTNQAIKHLQDFRKHLGKSDATEDIKAILTKNVNAIEESF